MTIKDKKYNNIIKQEIETVCENVILIDEYDNIMLYRVSDIHTYNIIEKLDYIDTISETLVDKL